MHAILDPNRQDKVNVNRPGLSSVPKGEANMKQLAKSLCLSVAKRSKLVRSVASFIHYSTTVAGPRVNEARQAYCRAHGTVVLDLFKEFLSTKAAVDEEHWSRIEQNIKHPSPVLRYYATSVLDVFMPDFRSRLTERYRMQQYEMMHTFLQYPFYPHADHMDKRLFPYEDARANLDHLDILDYGCGIGHGLICLLRDNPGLVRSITLVDLDLLHLDFLVFACRRLAPMIPVTIHRLADTNAIPEISGKHNTIISTDVLEHLLEPANAMTTILSSACHSPVRCYFDLELHETGSQHVIHDTRFLHGLVEGQGFTFTQKAHGISLYTR